LLRDQESEH
jgi:hypothetical protein